MGQYKIGKKAYQDAYNKANKEILNLKRKQWRKDNPELAIEQDRKSRIIAKAKPDYKIKGKQYHKKYYEKNKTKIKEKLKIYRSSNKDRQKVLGHRWFMKNYDRIRDNELKRKYGIGLEQKQQMITAQNNRCAICDEEMKVKQNIDHCHKTGKIRGVLCSRCNMGIGHFNDNIYIMARAIEYMKKWQG